MAQPPILIIVAAVMIAIVLVESMTKGTIGRGRSDGFYALANAIASAEGYGRPGVIPTVRNNPGDLINSAGQIQSFGTPAEGWDALYRQLDLIRTGGSRYYRRTMTMIEFANTWTATEQAAWLSNVLASLSAQGYVVPASMTIGAGPSHDETNEGLSPARDRHRRLGLVVVPPESRLIADSERRRIRAARPTRDRPPPCPRSAGSCPSMIPRS